MSSPFLSLTKRFVKVAPYGMNCAGVSFRPVTPPSYSESLMRSYLRPDARCGDCVAPLGIWLGNRVLARGRSRLGHDGHEQRRELHFSLTRGAPGVAGSPEWHKSEARPTTKNVRIPPTPGTCLGSHSCLYTYTVVLSPHADCWPGRASPFGSFVVPIPRIQPQIEAYGHGVPRWANWLRRMLSEQSDPLIWACRFITAYQAELREGPAKLTGCYQAPPSHAGTPTRRNATRQSLPGRIAEDGRRRPHDGFCPCFREVSGHERSGKQTAARFAATYCLSYPERPEPESEAAKTEGPASP